MDNDFKYQFLDRLKGDCLYYINQARTTKYLYFQDVKKHIREMRKIYNSFALGDRPEWLTMEDILDFEKKMFFLEKIIDVSNNNFISRNYGDVERCNKSAKNLLYAASRAAGGGVYIAQFHAQEGLEKYNECDEIKNFGCDFILPRFDKTIDTILKEHTKEICGIVDIVYKAGGVLVFWK